MKYRGSNHQSQAINRAEQLAAFLAAYNFAKRLKTQRGLTPHEYVSKIWGAKPDAFRQNPTQLASGLCA